MKQRCPWTQEARNQMPEASLDPMDLVFPTGLWLLASGLYFRASRIRKGNKRPANEKNGKWGIPILGGLNCLTAVCSAAGFIVMAGRRFLGQVLFVRFCQCYVQRFL